MTVHPRYHITRDQAETILAEHAGAQQRGDEPRVGVAHVPTAETRLHGPGSAGGEDVSLYGEEVYGEHLYAYDLATGEPILIER